MLFRKKIDKVHDDRSAILAHVPRRQADIGHLSKRHRISEFLPFLSHDPETRLIFSADKDLSSSIGALYMAAAPLSWANDQLLRELRSMVTNPLPKDTFVQFIRFDVPDIQDFLTDYKKARIEASERSGDVQSAEIAMLYARFLTTLVEKPPFKGNAAKLSDSFLLFAINIPAPELPSEEFIKETDLIIENAAAALPSLHLQRANPEAFVGMWRRFLHYYSPWDWSMNERELLREQIPGPGDGLIDRDGHIESLIGRDEPDVVITPLSIKEFPEEHSLTVMDSLMGDQTGVKSGCPDPVMWSWTARVPDQNSKRNWIKSRHANINFQAFGPSAKWIPRIGYKKQGFDNLVHMIEGQGDGVLEVMLTAFVFSKSKEAAARSVPVLQSLCRSWNFDIRVDDLIPLPVFLNSLPLYPNMESTAMLYRFKTMSTTQAVSVLPVFGDWKGPGVQGELAREGAGTALATRRGNICLFDIFSSNGNYNFVISGGTGSGKTAFALGLIEDQLSINARCWIIEIGRGFEKMCKVKKGVHMAFDEHSRVCLNPFSMIDDLEEELDELAGIHATMISPNDPVSPEDMAFLKEAIRSVYGEKGPNASPTDVHHYLFAQKEPRNQMLARMMHDFTMDGAYGRFFTGKANVDLAHRFMVLELSDLQSRKTLQAVILLQLMFAIQRQMYLGGPSSGERNILFVDEASELLKIEASASFLEGAYRRARKNKAGIGVGIQSISDLFLTKSTEIIASQSEHRILLFQEPESIKRAMGRGEILLSEYGMDCLNSLRKMDGFREMVIASGGGVGVFRYVLDPYRLAMFSSTGPARDEVLADMAQGMDADTALRKYLDKYKPGWEKAYAPVTNEEGHMIEGVPHG
ncbi:type IV secretion system protein TraC [Acidithiobacillus sp. MC6.1]|nr:type IV secretion system protein TraC [Acidithiobacillus sp. MC6.1]